MKVVSFFSSEYPLTKRIAGVIRSLTYNGFGRTLLKINDKYKFTTFNNTRRFIKFCKTCEHPFNRIRRRAIARKIRRNSKNAVLLSEEQGYKILAPGMIPESDKVIAACQKFYRESQTKLQNLVGKTNFCYMLLQTAADEYDLKLNSSDIYDLTLIPGLTEFALSPTLLEAAAGYLGEAPVLAGVTIYASFPNDAKIGSQLFHIDKDDFRQVKFIFAITDAHEENAPFTFLPADKAQCVEEKLGETFYGRVADEAAYDVVGKDAAVKFLGPAGSCLIIDTGRCLHYGSRGNKQFRCLLEIQFMSRFNSGEPSFYFSCVKAEKLPDHLTSLQRLALTGIKFIED